MRVATSQTCGAPAGMSSRSGPTCSAKGPRSLLRTVTGTGTRVPSPPRVSPQPPDVAGLPWSAGAAGSADTWSESVSWSPTAATAREVRVTTRGAKGSGLGARAAARASARASVGRARISRCDAPSSPTASRASPYGRDENTALAVTCSVADDPVARSGTAVPFATCAVVLPSSNTAPSSVTAPVSDPVGTSEGPPATRSSRISTRTDPFPSSPRVTAADADTERDARAAVSASMSRARASTVPAWSPARAAYQERSCAPRPVMLHVASCPAAAVSGSADPAQRLEL